MRTRVWSHRILADQAEELFPLMQSPPNPLNLELQVDSVDVEEEDQAQSHYLFVVLSR